VDAMLAPQAANERFIAASEFLWLNEIAAVLREELGERAAKVPRRQLPDLLVRFAGLFSQHARFLAPRLGKRQVVSHAKAERLLGWQPSSWRKTVLDTATSVLANVPAGRLSSANAPYGAL
jgi:dihydroflavonol-4-reductase